MAAHSTACCPSAVTRSRFLRQCCRMLLRRVRVPERQEPKLMTTPTGPTPRPGILDIAPYIGGEAKIAGVGKPIRLASNESALGPSAKAITAYRALADEIHRYPDGNAFELREALG